MHKISLNFSEAVSSFCRDDAKFKNHYLKANSNLRKYAKIIGKAFEELNFTDLCDFNHPRQLNSDLLRFLNECVRSEIYRNDTKHHIRKMLENVFPGVEDDESSGGLADVFSPHSDTFKRFLLELPRVGSNSKTRPSADGDGARLQLPLTETGKVIFCAVIDAAQKLEITDETVLFAGSRDFIITKIKETVAPKFWNSNVYTFNRICLRLGFKVNPESKSLSRADCPAKIVQAIERYEANAPRGLRMNYTQTPTATRFTRNVEPHAPRTIQSYVQAFLRGLGAIKNYLEPGMSLADLLTLKDYSIKLDDTEFLYYCNPLVEKLREIELTAETHIKRVGFDSYVFNNFYYALKAIAAFDNQLPLLDRFEREYRIKLDYKRVQARREEKKSAFERESLDVQILVLRSRFDKIVRSRQFVFKAGKVPRSEAAENLRFCLFFVSLITMRYMGFRQSQMRDCVFLENIVFEKDKSIQFYWPQEKMKNNIVYKANVSYAKHSYTHSLFLDVLNDYKTYIYPHIRESGAEKLGNQFFATLDINGNPQQAFGGESNFSHTFKNWSLSYLNFDDKLQLQYSGINPHYLRGVCVDWLYYDLGATLRYVAEFIGDTEKTVLEHYLMKQTVYNATLPLTLINAKIAERDYLENFQDARHMLAEPLNRNRDPIPPLKHQLILPPEARF